MCWGPRALVISLYYLSVALGFGGPHPICPVHKAPAKTWILKYTTGWENKKSHFESNSYWCCFSARCQQACYLKIRGYAVLKTCCFALHVLRMKTSPCQTYKASIWRLWCKGGERLDTCGRSQILSRSQHFVYVRGRKR